MQKFSKIRTFNVHRKAIAKIKDIPCLKILHFRGYYGVKQSRNKSKKTHVISLIHRYFFDLISFIFLTVKNLFLVHFCCTFVTRNKIIFITLTSEKPEWGHKIETNKSI